MAEKPTLPRRQLGMELKRLREDVEVSRDEAAAALERDTSMISRIENGVSGIRLIDLERLLNLYGITDERRDLELALGEAARQRRRKKTTYVDTVPHWFKRYVALEREATEIRNVEAELIPGLLQSEGYARALMNTALTFVGEEEVERRIETRLARQELLERKEPAAPLFWFVLGEATLRRVVGSAAVMRDQLNRLLEISKLPNVRVQVLPFEAGEHAAVGFSYAILRFGDDPAADIVFIDNMSGAVYPERPADIEWYSVVFGQLQVIAAGPKKTRTIIAEVAREHT